MNRSRLTRITPALTMLRTSPGRRRPAPRPGPLTSGRHSQTVLGAGFGMQWPGSCGAGSRGQRCRLAAWRAARGPGAGAGRTGEGGRPGSPARRGGRTRRASGRPGSGVAKAVRPRRGPGPAPARRPGLWAVASTLKSGSGLEETDQNRSVSSIHPRRTTHAGTPGASPGARPAGTARSARGGPHPAPRSTKRAGPPPRSRASELAAAHASTPPATTRGRASPRPGAPVRALRRAACRGRVARSRSPARHRAPRRSGARRPRGRRSRGGAARRGRRR